MDAPGRPLPPPTLLGRDGEIGFIRRLLREPGETALAVHGVLGVGKTALLGRVAALAERDGDRVLWATAVEAEAGLPYAGLHQLLLPVLELAAGLAPTPRDDLAAAFGPDRERSVGRLEMSTALRALLAAVAAQGARPLLVVDDAHWTDRASLATLALLAREPLPAGASLLFGVRADPAGLGPFSEFRCRQLEGLDTATAATLVTRLAGRTVDHGARDRIAAATGGNPLAILEFVSDQRPAVLTGAEVLPDPVPLTGELQEVYVARFRALTDRAQQLVVLAAAEADSASRGLTAAIIGGDLVSAADDAAGFVTLEPRLAFRHPLLRSAAYWGASPAQRRSAHSALAAASGLDESPERRLLHLARAALGSDDALARELAEAAEHLGRRGRWRTAAALTEASARLTLHAPLRAERLLAAARARLSAGDLLKAQALLDRAGPALTEQRTRGLARRLQGDILFAGGDPAGAASALIEAVRLLEDEDPRLARDTLFDAFDAAHLSGGLHRDVTLAGVFAMVSGYGPPDDESPSDLLLAAMERGATEDAAGISYVRRALACVETGDGEQIVRVLPFAWTMAGELYDDAAWRDASNRWLDVARAEGGPANVLLALGRTSYVDVLTGRFSEAEAANQQVRSLAAASGESRPLSGYSTSEFSLLAWQGHVAEVRSQAPELTAHFMRLGRGMAVLIVQCALTTLELAVGDYEAAMRAARRVRESSGVFHMHVEPDLVEAAVRCGAREVARAAHVALRRRVEAGPATWGAGMLARTTALLAETDEAEPAYRRSIELLGTTEMAPQLARSHLLYGEWLRRQRRRREARLQLEAAREIFESLGAEAFAARAREELTATTNAGAPRRTNAGPDELTAQEQHVAALASLGWSNRQIAVRLAIETTTVAHHLRGVFRKLNVTSRAKLVSALRAAENESSFTRRENLRDRDAAP